MTRILPLLLCLCLSISLTIVSRCLSYRIDVIQTRADEVELYYATQFRELATAAAESDMVLFKRQSQIIGELKRVIHNQDLLINKSLTEAQEGIE